MKSDKNIPFGFTQRRLAAFQQQCNKLHKRKRFGNAVVSFTERNYNCKKVILRKRLEL